MYKRNEYVGDYVFRASEIAHEMGDVEVAAILRAFSQEWRAVNLGNGSSPMTWNMARVSNTGRAALMLADKYVDLKGEM